MKLDELFAAAVVAQLELPKASTVANGTDVHEVVRTMRKASLSAIQVVSDSKIVGIFTDVDYVRKIMGRAVPAGTAIDELMTPNPVTVTRETKLSECFKRMSRGSFRNLPVVNKDGGPIELLGVRDLVQYLAELYPAEILAMAPDVHQVVEADGG